MANEIIGEKRAGEGRIRSSGGVAIFEETYEYLVKSDNKENSRINIITTPGLPVVNVTQSAFGFTICKTKDATRREENPLYWDVTCEFSSEVDERQSGQDPETDPTEWLPIYETKFERLQEVVTKDLDDDAIANSAGQPYETGLTISRFIPVWEFYQFEAASITDEQVIDRNEVINSTTFKGRAAETLLLSVMSSVVGFYYGSRRRLTQYSLKYNSRKWTHKRLDVGTVYLSGGVHLPYLDDEGNMMLGALDGAGAKQPVGTAPAVREFDMYPQISFSFLRV